MFFLLLHFKFIIGLSDLWVFLCHWKQAIDSFLVCHIQRHKHTREMGKVEGSMEARDNVNVVTILYLLFQCHFQSQLNTVRVWLGQRWMENCTPVSGTSVQSQLIWAGSIKTCDYCRIFLPREWMLIVPFLLKTKARCEWVFYQVWKTVKI